MTPEEQRQQTLRIIRELIEKYAAEYEDEVRFGWQERHNEVRDGYLERLAASMHLARTCQLVSTQDLADLELEVDKAQQKLFARAKANSAIENMTADCVRR